VYLFFSKKLYNLSIGQYFYRVCFKLAAVILISAPLPIFVSLHTENWIALFATSSSFILPFLLSSLFFGLDKNERTMIFGFIKKKTLPQKQ
jgi:hypothetical protein